MNSRGQALVEMLVCVWVIVSIALGGLHLLGLLNTRLDNEARLRAKAFQYKTRRQGRPYHRFHHQTETTLPKEFQFYDQSTQTRDQQTAGDS